MLSTAKGASMRSRLGSTSAADAGAAAGRRRTIAITQRIWTPRSLEGPRTRKPDCRCATLYDDPRRLQMTSLWASPPADYSGLDGLRIAFARISQPNPLQGALVALAELPEARDRAQRSPALDAMASWLAQFIAQRGTATDAGEHAEWRQLSSLCRAVNEQVLLGSERE